MYLRNDFRFECAYCRMREQDTGILCEKYFEKDHFIARNSKSDIDLDSYDNMVYACSKCNGTKADKDTELLLNPCKDDIYLGSTPHVKNLGKNGQYQLVGNTDRRVAIHKQSAAKFKILQRIEKKAGAGGQGR